MRNTLGCLLAPVAFSLVMVGAIFGLGLLARWGVMWSVIWMILGLVVCAACAVIAVSSGSRHTGIIAVVAMLFTTSIAFGLGYFALYRSGGGHFAYDGRLLDEETLGRQQEVHSTLIGDDVLVEGLLRLRNFCSHNPYVVINAEEDSMVIAGGWKYVKYTVVDTSEYGSTSYSAARFETPQGMTRELDVMGWPGTDDRMGLSRAVAEASSPPVIVSACDALLELIQRQHGELLNSVNHESAMSVALNAADFIYFSVTILTTVGSGDIMPGSTWSRMLIALEAIMAVAIVSFGVDLLLGMKPKGKPVPA